MQAQRGKLFEASYDGVTYRQVYRLDARLVVPGVLLMAMAPGAAALTWPAGGAALLIAALGACLITLGLVRRMHFEASPGGYRLGWRIGPVGRTVRLPGEQTTPFAVRGRHGAYRVTLRRGWRRYEPFIQAAGRGQAEAWVRFLDAVTRGEPGVWSDAPGADQPPGAGDLPWPAEVPADEDRKPA